MKEAFQMTCLIDSRINAFQLCFQTQHSNNPTLTKAFLTAKPFWDLSLIPLDAWTKAESFLEESLF